jgi:hypothetical protein
MPSLRIVLSIALITCGAFAEESPGVVLHEEGAFEGYNLYSPLDGVGSYLLDNDGRVVHFWDTEYRSNVGYLQDNGNLLRTTTFGNGGNKHLFGGGAGHGIQELSWDGELLWEFVHSSEDYLMHHDIEPLPNGNVLMISWERKSTEETIAAGRNPEYVGDKGLWPLHVFEVAPTRPKGGEIVWEWHVWDHLIQDFDESKDNYGDVAAHPELVEINPPGFWMDRISDEEREQLEALGYLGGEPEDDKAKDKKRERAKSADWLHTNAIAYNAELDQIAVSALGNNEIWIIDHSTTTEEANSHTGGRYGKGGDLLYRWGNPVAYRAGGEDDQTLFAQHNVQWIPAGYPGASHLLIFNNGRGRPEGNYSSIVELAPMHDTGTGYVLKEGEAFGPSAPTWEYTAPKKEDFYSQFISGAQRLPNGNTLVCYGANGIFFEVTPKGEEVWRFVNPIIGPEGSGHSGDDKEPSNIVFRVHRYAPDHPAFADKDLTPGLELTEYLKKHPGKMPLTLEDYQGEPKDD